MSLINDILLSKQNRFDKLDNLLKNNKIDYDSYKLKKDQIDKESKDEIEIINENKKQITKRDLTKEFNDILDKEKKKTDKLKTDSTKYNIKFGNKFKIPLTSANGVIGAMAVLISTLLSKIARNNKQIELLVNKTNKIIENIVTKDDIIKARNIRDNTLKIINSSEKSLKSVSNLVSTIGTIINVLSPIIALLSNNPLPVPSVVETKKNLIKNIFEGLSIISGIVNIVLAKLIFNLEIQKNRLKNISDILDSSLESLSLEEVKKIFDSSNYGKLGRIPGIQYKGYTFAIKEEENSKFIVRGYKRRYAVALDSNYQIRFVGNPSFSFDPEILIQELSLTIL